MPCSDVHPTCYATAKRTIDARSDRKVHDPSAMRIFHCERCDTVVRFDADRCPACAAPIGYDTTSRTLRVLAATPDPTVYAVDGRPAWRCLNAAWGCNWMLPAGSSTPWCRSCRMTRGRPDEERPAAVEAWASAEVAKRRLVHQLDVIGLPIDIRSDEHPDGLAFDLVHLPGRGSVTGHLGGIVTLDLCETDDEHRESLRRQLGEGFRTVIGHLRHEVGHHYWARLVGRTDTVDAFRALFGDERVDYPESIDRHYFGGRDRWDPLEFVTDYAASHPLEDWAETFAHYLHIGDVVDTAAAHGLLPPDVGERVVADATATLEFGELLDVWRPINAAVDAIAEAVGAPPVYPFDPAGLVVDKLDFVHRRIGSERERERSDAPR